MKCEICSLDSATDSIMWKCIGCPRVFHASCVGVVIQRNTLRSKKVDSSAYLLPCCQTCQELVNAKLEINSLAEEQKKLAELIHKNTEVAHRFALQHDQSNMILEAIEGLEIAMQAIKLELTTINKNSTLAGSVAALKNHATSLFDTAMLTSQECLTKSINSVTSGLSKDLCNINEELSQLQQLSMEIASSCTITSNPVLELDILDELKTLSANIASARCRSPSPPTPDYPSLDIELNRKLKLNDSGWRLLGTKKVWKADWAEFDIRQSRRREQQKNADKAKKRRKRQRQIKPIKKPSTDKELLAAAKVTFNRKPQPKTKIPTFINFQRGDTLNPGPSTVSSNTPPLDPGPSSVSPNTPPHHDRLPARFPTTAAATTSPYQANMCTHHPSTSMPPYATFNPCPTSFSAPFAGPCYHHGPNAFDFNNPVMYPYFLPHRRVPL